MQVKIRTPPRVKTEPTVLFKSFCSRQGKTDLEYWFYEEPELDKMLEQFWFGARKDINLESDNESEAANDEDLLYSANTMKNFRYALNRILKNKGHLYDIINTSNLSFKRSQKAFFASQKELKEKGKGQIYSAPEITEAGTDCVHYQLRSKTKNETKTKTKH